jgi:hypothetical protein
MDEKSRLLEQAERCRRIAERINEPVAAGAVLRLAEEYEQQAGAVKEIPDIEASNTTTGDENAIYHSSRVRAGAHQFGRQSGSPVRWQSGHDRQGIS